MASADDPDATLKTAIDSLGDDDSYTVHRLKHASPEHLYLTTRRCFIGPIPEGWLKTHRKEWYKHYLGIHHSSKAPSFSASDDVGRRRRLTGLDAPNPSALYRASFPQPDNAHGEALREDEHESDGEATIRAPAALNIPRGGLSDPALLKEQGENAEEVLASYTTAHTVASPSTPTPLATPRPGAAPSDYMDSRPTDTFRRRDTSDASFVTASDGGSMILDEPGAAFHDHSESSSDHDTTPKNSPRTGGERSSASFETTNLATPGPTTSDTSLLASQHAQQLSQGVVEEDALGAALNLEPQRDPPQAAGQENRNSHEIRSPGLVKFNIPENPMLKQEVQVRAKMAQGMRTSRLSRAFTRGKLKDGEIVKVEKMLVRLDITTGSEQPNDDYDEKDSQRVETRITEKWREFMVVCRESHEDGAVLCLQMYKTRVIPATNQSKTKKRFKHEILLDPAKLKVNLYSSLDKTLVLWQAKGPQTIICFLRPRSAPSAVEWYTFLRGVLGLHRPRTLQINIPDLSVGLRLDNPFEELVSEEALEKAADGDEAAICKAMQAERAIASKIIDRCLEMLSQSKEWDDVLKTWGHKSKIGLAWKRYDRLEWVHGINEHKMYGTMALQRTHELELRPKKHYPVSVKMVNGENMQEPAPVEGFLIRLTSQKGTDQKFGKLFYKRLYFSTQNNYLLFLRPAKAKPPPPPKMPMKENCNIPSAKQIAEKIPLIYAVNPFPMHAGTVAWLSDSANDAEDRKRHDRDAHDEAERNAQSLLDCDGFINLSDVVEVRNVVRGATPADEAVDEGPQVDFDEEVEDSHHDDGTTKEFDDARTFELLMRNGLVVRLQAFSKATKKEWIRRLRALAKYWTRRASQDLALFKLVRQQNLDTLNIDMQAEAYVGMFAHKWEVTKSFASPELYNVCGISNCRAIHRSGILFRKPRVHGIFSRCHVILCHGHLLVFEDTVRSATGKKVSHIHHQRIASIDLRGCYLYSGLITANDLLYSNRTFDNNRPGNDALPRMYLEDGWASADDDAMTTFVVWTGQHKGWFRAREEDGNEGQQKSGGARNKLKRVSQLGTTGRAIVFKARSRTERDHWVLGIETEMERLSQAEEVRVVGEGAAAQS
ncbi:hypothetical protein M436DRAFT_43195 [Aureobasidium namibiae CBS 147.97]|uniref:PH domain-containing protein n=1 Tax=Aureobasidium namibiae CBS 147.97 TaxID=1043004 RepID=A0A074WNH6_9PEZI|nr:uncharacterized protein M436DRAFT_43195 [Aureobasidium namibiae CBS 147.97]KEQ74693.1 hypothetical protein M436DRAFT_43195 [Aureobasidium namibiae CBS 147.97]